MRVKTANWSKACLAAALLALAACATPRPAVRPTAAVAPETQPAWRGLIEPVDASRVGGLASAWTRALETARRAGFTRALRREGPLFDPSIALPAPAPAPGAYRCRLFRLGAGPRGSRAFALAGSFYCFISVEGGQLRFVRETGSPRPIGFLYEDADPSRLIFIGTAATGRELNVPAYGDRPERDAVGVMQRVDNFRYRLALPWRGGAALEIYELVPEL